MIARLHRLGACAALLLAAAAPATAQLPNAPAAGAPTVAASAAQTAAEARLTQKELKTTTAEDDAITARVRARLLRTPEFGDVQAEVNAGVVRLSGNVSSEEDRRRLPVVVKGLAGVLDVDNNVRLNTNLDERLNAAWDLVKDRATRMVATLPVLVVALVILWLFTRAGRWFSSRPKLLGWQSPNPYLMGVVQRAIGLVFTLAGVLIALDLLGATALVGAVIGSAGVMGIVVGFAFRDVAENYLAGILLSLRRPFEPGDHIVVGDKHEGKVMGLNARATTLMKLDGTHLRLPNAMVFKEVLLNYTRNPRRRFGFTLGMAADDNLAEAQRVGLEVLVGMTGVLKDPAPRALISDAGDSTVKLDFFAWVDQREADFGRVRSEAIRLVMHAMRQAGLEIPEPTYRVQWVNPDQAPAAVRAEQAVVTAPPDQPEPPADLVQEDVSVNRELDAQMAEARAHQPQDDLLTRPSSRRAATE